MASIKIACPKCEWEPDGKPYWRCSCGCKWDTFSTGGRCPACKHNWEDTQCISCQAWSKHEDWYSGLDGIVKEFLKEAQEKKNPVGA